MKNILKKVLSLAAIAVLSCVPAFAANIEIQTKVDGHWVIVIPSAKLGGHVIRLPDGTRVTDRVTRGSQNRFVVRADIEAGEYYYTPVYWTLNSTLGQHGGGEYLNTPDVSRVFVIPTSPNADNVTIKMEVWMILSPGSVVNFQEQRIPVGTRP